MHTYRASYIMRREGGWDRQGKTKKLSQRGSRSTEGTADWADEDRGRVSQPSWQKVLVLRATGPLLNSGNCYDRGIFYVEKTASEYQGSLVVY